MEADGPIGQATVIADRRFSFLANARREAERRGLFDVPVVDCDCHVYETTAIHPPPPGFHGHSFGR